METLSFGTIANYFSGKTGNNRIEVARLLKGGALLFGDPKLQKRAKFLAGATSLGETAWVAAALVDTVSDLGDPEKTTKEKAMSVAGWGFYLMETGVRAYNSCLAPLYKWEKAGKEITALGDFGGFMCGVFMMKKNYTTYFNPRKAVEDAVKAKEKRETKAFGTKITLPALTDVRMAFQIKMTKVVAEAYFTFGAAFALLEGAVLVNTFKLLGATRKIPSWVILASSAVMLFSNISANYFGQFKIQ